MTAHERPVWTTRDLVEQATAFGRSVEWMVAKLGVTEEYIAEVWDGMDEAHRAPATRPCPGAGKRKAA